MKIIIAILMFSFIIIFHELGHFLLAKKNKIKVNVWDLDQRYLELQRERQNIP